VIRRALNRTQTALSALFHSIELKLRRTSARQRTEPRAGGTGNNNHSRRESRRRADKRRRDERLSGVVDAVELTARLAWIVLPVIAATLAARAAYSNYRAYVVDDDRRRTISDRLWIDVGTRLAAKSRRCRRRAAAESSSMSAADVRRAAEYSSTGDDVFVVVLHVGLSAACCVFDVALHWLLVVVRRHTAPPPFDFTGASSVDAVTTGEGTIVAVLADFLTILHAGHWFGFTETGYVCSVQPTSPDYLTVVLVVCLYVVLLALVALQSSVRSWQNRVAAFFYPEHELRKRRLYGALATARRDRRPQLSGGDDDAGSQKDMLRDLMCVGPTSWRPETLMAVRRAAEPPPRCVACGQAVSRRARKTSKRGRCLSDDDCLDVCPVCDCRLTDDDDDDVFINAC